MHKRTVMAKEAPNIDQVQDTITVGEFYALAAGGQVIFT
jgi:hypothetical protein